MTTVLDINVFLDEYKLEESALKIIGHVRPQWKENQLAFKVFTDGITNKLIGCWSIEDSSDVILVRIYGKNTNLLIDREEEKANFILLHKAGYAPQLYATFKNGLAYAYVPGETVTTCTVRDVSVYPLIAVTMARIHSIHTDQPRHPIIWEKTKKFLSLVPNQYSSTKTEETYKEHFPDGTATLSDELQLLKNLLSEEENAIVFCHNDLLLPNIIHQNGKVSFIDYEYAGWNYQAFDIGNHFAEFAGVSEVDYSLYPDRDFQYSWIKIYMDEYNKCNNITKELIDSDINKFYSQINKFALVSHLFWASWALVQAQHSTINFNFMGYAITRMEEYYKKKNIILKLS
uniref:ethanolamine kinase n=1 Tax=Triatoma dimidiata TaxID=72491 RepID=A0A0V0GBQ0_TRIDM